MRCKRDHSAAPTTRTARTSRTSHGQLTPKSLARTASPSACHAWAPVAHGRRSRPPRPADDARFRMRRPRRLAVPLVLSCAARPRLLRELRPRRAGQVRPGRSAWAVRRAAPRRRA
jgi:hypothetical protein